MVKKSVNQAAPGTYEEHQIEVREEALRGGAQPTPVIDRFWFKPVNFREPSGVLFGLATDGPGFRSR